MAQKKRYQTGVHQTGKTFLPADRMILAKKPGIRETVWGTTYYEYRKNRSDLNKKKRI